MMVSNRNLLLPVYFQMLRYFQGGYVLENQHFETQIMELWFRWFFFCSFRWWFLGSLAVNFQGFIHELCSLLEWNWIMGGIFFKSLSPRICSWKPREFFLRGNHGLGWNITLIWKETLILEIHPLSIEPMIVGGRVLRNSKVDGTVPRYWFIRTRFKPTFWYLCHLFLTLG